MISAATVTRRPRRMHNCVLRPSYELLTPPERWELNLGLLDSTRKKPRLVEFITKGPYGTGRLPMTAEILSITRVRGQPGKFSFTGVLVKVNGIRLRSEEQVEGEFIFLPEGSEADADVGHINLHGAVPD